MTTVWPSCDATTLELTKRQVMTESGILLGQVAGIEVDPQTLQLARIEVSAGFFKSELAAARSTCSDLRFAVARVPSRSPGATQLTSVSGANATAMQRVR